MATKTNSALILMGFPGSSLGEIRFHVLINHGDLMARGYRFRKQRKGACGLRGPDLGEQ